MSAVFLILCVHLIYVHFAMFTGAERSYARAFFLSFSQSQSFSIFIHCKMATMKRNCRLFFHHHYKMLLLNFFLLYFCLLLCCKFYTGLTNLMWFACFLCIPFWPRHLKLFVWTYIQRAPGYLQIDLINTN